MATPSEDEQRFDAYVERLGEAAGHADRAGPLRAYLTGLMLPGERKSVEPMAAKVDPRHVSARHQSMHHFVANAPWDEGEVLGEAVVYALEAMERHAPVAAWVVDDTGFPKKGAHSVGVARQYCGILGKEENCQVAVSVSLVNEVMSVPAAYRLYLPEGWAKDEERRQEAGVPADVGFEPKWKIARDEIDTMVEDELPNAPVVADAGFGDITEFRDSLTRRRLPYVVGIKPDTTLWPPGKGPLLPHERPRSGRGRAPRKLGRDATHRPSTARAIALALPGSAWKMVRWRPGRRFRSRFAGVRVRPAHRDYQREEPRPEEWLLVEWPPGEKEPTDWWLSTLPKDVALRQLVQLAKMRWRIERDYEELKSELGLDHYEGRGWRGFHHHGVLCIAAYAFLAAERARLSPPQPLAFLRPAALPEGFRPRGAPAPRRAS